ncbi:MAG TPA: PEP-CTERM sorting domain-containing protein [Bryobacteraceae bacterium]
MKRFCGTLLGSYLLLALAAAVPACATVIDFEAEAGNRGGNLTGIPDSPLTIGGATFTGGELLTGEVGLNADQTGVYATEGLFGSGETNPLVITFATPVQDFSLFVLNGDDARSYTVSDNLGESLTNPLPSAGGVGGAMFSLPGNEITTVMIASANQDAWDFAIDRVSFNTAAPTPEPESLLLLGFGFVLVGVAHRRQFRSWLRK